MRIKDMSMPTADSYVKRWLPNTNFGNQYNWDAGRAPCGNDKAVFYDDSPSVFLQMNTTVKELVLPRTSDILLDSNTILAFTDVADNNPSCLSDGKEVGFNKTYPSDWLDPRNWCTEESGNCSEKIILESEMVPCSYDDVVFPTDSTFFVNVESGLEIVIKTLKIRGQAFSTQSFSSFLSTDIGKGMFPKPHTGKRSKIKMLRRPCNDPIGCKCGNDKSAILQRICAIQKPHCEKPVCKNPIFLAGGCCEICGAKLTAEYGSGFKYDTLKNGLQRNFLDGMKDLQTVKFSVSRMSTDKIQIALTDQHGGVTSKIVASKMKADIDSDIASGGFKYSLRKIALEQSGPPSNTPKTGARKGSMDGESAGEKAGIVIGVLIAIAIIVVVLFFIYKKKRSNNEVSKFQLFDKISFRRKLKRPQVEVPPFFGFGFRTEPDNVGPSHQGFSNPMFGNSSDDSKPIDLELMPPALESQEQPTFDRSGFDNPLYGTQDSPFSDPTKAEDHDKKTVKE